MKLYIHIEYKHQNNRWNYQIYQPEKHQFWWKILEIIFQGQLLWWPVVWPPTVSTIAPWHRITDHNQSLCETSSHLNVPWIALTTSGVHMCSWLPWVANSIATANSSARSSPGFSHESTDLSILTDHHLQSWSIEKIGCNLKAHWKDGSWWKDIQKKCELKSSGLASVCNKMPAGCAGYSLARQIGVHGGQKVFRW